MYKEFYGLREDPFNLTPDPQFLFLSKRHADAFQYLIYGIKVRKGFILVTGEVGSGKTTLCRALLSKLEKEVDSALILNPHLSEKDLLGTIIEDLGMTRGDKSENELLEQLRSFLLKRLNEGGNVVIIIDEAQNLSFEILEKIRLLSNLETEKEKLLQIILVGQWELEEKLKKPALRPVNQRIAVKYRLGPLNKGEVEDYIQHRLKVAGSSGNLTFTRAAAKRIFSYSQGIPRIINLVCDRAMLAGYYGGYKKITARLIKTAISDLRGDFFLKPPKRRVLWVSGGLFLVLVLLASFWFQGSIRNAPQKLTSSPLPEMRVKKDPPPSLENEILVEKEGTNLGKEEDIAKETEAIDIDDRIASLGILLNLWGISDSMPTKKEILPENKEDYFWLERIVKIHRMEIMYLETDLEQLEAWDIPCILLGVTEEKENRKMWMVLLKISDREVTIFHPKNGRMEVSRKSITDNWDNRAVILWRDPDQTTPTFRFGMKGEEVRKLTKRFKALGYFKGIPSRDVYDQEMREVVAHFQREHGLKEDGILGPRTKMVLYHVLDRFSAPRLHSE